MFYFDIENPAHLGVAVLGAALLAACLALLIYNWRRPVPVVLPSRTLVGATEVVTGLELAPKIDESNVESRDKVEIFILAPEKVPYGCMFRIFVNINNLERGRTSTNSEVNFEALFASLARGDAVGLTLQSSELYIDTPYLALDWDRQDHVAVFNLRVREKKGYQKLSKIRLSVVVGDLPLGEIDFEIIIDGKATDAVTTHRQNTRVTLDNLNNDMRKLPIKESGFKANKFRSAFISYSQKNTHEMGLFCTGLDEKGLDIKLDKFLLRDGDNWDDQAKELIDQCDVVFLLWSPEAAASPAVALEVDYAADRRRQHGRPALHPVLVKYAADLKPPPHIPSNFLWAGRFSTFVRERSSEDSPVECDVNGS